MWYKRKQQKDWQSNTFNAMFPWLPRNPESSLASKNHSQLEQMLPFSHMSLAEQLFTFQKYFCLCSILSLRQVKEFLLNGLEFVATANSPISFGSRRTLALFIASTLFRPGVFSFFCFCFKSLLLCTFFPSIHLQQQFTFSA